MQVKAHTILFTEACPLACRYCYLKDDECFGTAPPLNEQEIMDEIEYHNQHDDPTQCESQLLITGGEPFLYPDLIKKIIDKYQNRFMYRFNTSGYLLTPEMLEYLSHYKVSFCLSVDGDRNLTNYLRPVQSTKYHTGYMKKLEQIVPTLLYYFPSTPYRIIVNPRYADLIYDMYLFGEQLGFRHFTLILDFETRPANNKAAKTKEKPIIWTDHDTEVLSLQMTKIMNEIILGWENNINRPMVAEVDEVVNFLLNNKKFDADNLPCKVFAGRTLLSLNSRNSDYCMAESFESLEKCKEILIKQHEEQQGICKTDKECQAIEYCWHKCCPKNSFDAYGEFGHFDDLECALNKICYYNAIYLLAMANERCPDSPLYKFYIRRLEEHHGRESTNDMLPD